MRYRSKGLRAALLAAALLCATAALTGCGGGSDLNKAQQEQSTRLGQIAKRTDGDWSKLTEEERRFLVTEMSYGNESSARMLLLGAAGKIGGKPGGPVGRPGGPPGRLGGPPGAAPGGPPAPPGPQ